MPLNQFKKEAAAFHEGTEDFKLFKHNRRGAGGQTLQLCR